MLGLGDDFNLLFLPSLQIDCVSRIFIYSGPILAIGNDPREKKTLSKRQFTLFSNFIRSNFIRTYTIKEFYFFIL